VQHTQQPFLFIVFEAVALAIELKEIVCFADELLHASTMPVLEDAPPQIEMATEEVAAEALADRQYGYFGISPSTCRVLPELRGSQASPSTLEGSDAIVRNASTRQRE
jgi:hypothetical protein